MCFKLIPVFHWKLNIHIYIYIYIHLHTYTHTHADINVFKVKLRRDHIKEKQFAAQFKTFYLTSFCLISYFYRKQKQEFGHDILR
jgi:hypothetical protein